MDSSPQVGYVPIIDPEITSSGSEGDYDGSDSDISQELVTSNVGVMYQYLGQEERLLDERRAQDHIEFRNKYFTPDITRHNVYCKLTADTTDTVVNLKDYGFDIDRVIGFKLVKGYMKFNSSQNQSMEITIPEIPYLACKKNAEHASLIEVIYVSGADEYYENKNLFRDTFFNPIKLSTLNIKIEVAIVETNSFLEFEITTLNRSV